MGVNTLWDLLADAEEKDVRVTTLVGKRLAVDLSAWIVEFLQSKISEEFKNAYLRNLFYRTLYFMREGVRLVFVVDGRAPDMKQGSLVSRQQAQFGSPSNTANPDRPHLQKVTSQCVEMLSYLGLPCVQSKGEAEALCAHLNSSGLLDGCLTEDNDFFLYGGKTMYRKLKQDKKKKMYYVNKIDMNDINELDVGYERRDLVALALLLGCDYDDNKGVKRVGKEKGRALIQLLRSRNLDPLDRLLRWRENKELDNVEETLLRKVKHEAHCNKCDHLGRITVHKASGCTVCGTEGGCGTVGEVNRCTCEWHGQKELRKEHALELSLRQKSLEDKTFPDIKIVNEFLNPELPDCKTIPEPSMDLRNLIKFLQERLNWSYDKVLKKLVPALILKQLREERNQSKLMFTPIRVVRDCRENHVDCYEVSWDKTDRNDFASPTYSTNVPVKVERSLFKRVYPVVVEQFEKSLMAKKSSAGKKRKTDASKGQTTLDFTKIKKRLLYTEDACSSKLLNTKPATDFEENKTDMPNNKDMAVEKLQSFETGSICSSLQTVPVRQEEEIVSKAEKAKKKGVGSKSLEGNSQNLLLRYLEKKDGTGQSSQTSKSETDIVELKQKVSKAKKAKDKKVGRENSILNFFEKKVSKVESSQISRNETKIVEFKQNDTSAFRVLNSSKSLHDDKTS